MILRGSTLAKVGMPLAALFVVTASGFFACQNAERSADDVTFFGLLAVATIVFAGALYVLLQRLSPVKRVVLVLLAVIALIVVAIPVGAIIAFGECGHLRI
jgi:hypothetical protein